MAAAQAEVIVAGHICLDVIPEINTRDKGLEDILVPGKLVNIGPSIMATGGAVSNTGLALHRLGLATRLMGKVGDDQFGSAILQILREHDESLDELMIVSEGENSSYTIVISPPGVDRIFLHCTGANDTFQSGDISYEQLDGAKLFHFGYPPLMEGMYKNGGKELLNIFSNVKEKGIATSLDMALPDPQSSAGKADWCEILQEVLPYVDIFLPSFEEILFMLDRTTFDRLKEQGGDLLDHIAYDLLEGLSAKMLDWGVAIAAIKLGEHGVYVRTTGDISRMQSSALPLPDLESWIGREMLSPSYQVDVVGTTGAGDCTIAGFLAGLVKGESFEKVVQSAVAVGAFNVERADATSGVPSWDRIEQRLRNGWKKRALRLQLEQGEYISALELWAGPHDLKYGNR